MAQIEETVMVKNISTKQNYVWEKVKLLNLSESWFLPQ